MKQQALVLAVAIVVAAAMARVPSLAAEALNGTWTIASIGTSETVELELRRPRSVEADRVNITHDLDLRALGLQPADLTAAPHAAHFSLRRDAGVVDFSGIVGNGAGAGSFTFTPSQEYRQAISSRGIETPDDEKQLVATLLDISLGYTDGVIGAGVRPSSFDKLVAFRALGITGDGMRTLKHAFGDLSEEDYITFTALHITPEYAAQMRALGLPDLTAHDLVTLKALRIDSDYVHRVQAHGFKHPTVQQLVQLKAMHIL